MLLKLFIPLFCLKDSIYRYVWNKCEEAFPEQNIFHSMDSSLFDVRVTGSFQYNNGHFVNGKRDVGKKDFFSHIEQISNTFN